MPTPADHALLVNSLISARVLVVGDAFLEREVTGKAMGLAGSAPVPLIRWDGTEVKPGGAANLLRNLEAVRADCALATVVGTDAAGRELLGTLGSRGSNTDGVVQDPGFATPVRESFYAGGRLALRVERGGSTAVPATAVERLLAWVGRAIGQFDVLVLADHGSDLGGTLLTDEVLRRLTALAGMADRPVIVDPSGRDFGAYGPCHVIKPSLAELAHATGMHVETDADVVAASRVVMARHPVLAVATTRGERGMTLVPRDEEEVHLPSGAAPVADPEGSGDAASAILAAAMAVGATPRAAAELANVAAGVVAGRPGLAQLDTDEMLMAVHRAGLIPTGAKLVGRGSLKAVLEGCRAVGRRVGFLAGGFDLMGPAHLERLERARAACDFLVVGVAGDASVRRRRGAFRPVQGQQVRAATVASLPQVDRVVIFEEDCHAGLVLEVRPDVLAEGDEAGIPSASAGEFVRSYGGQVLPAPAATSVALVDRGGA